MKLCKDCFYYQKPVSCTDEVEKFSRCTAKHTVSPVTGKVMEEIHYCELMRTIGECGMEAKLYAEPEPREMWQRDEPQGVKPKASLDGLPGFATLWIACKTAPLTKK